MAQRHFEGKEHAELYQRHRVSPPQELIDEVLNFLRKRIKEELDLAVDVGCGSGQGTELLAPHFMTVVGTDISSAQLEIAEAKDHAANLSYRQSPAEELPFEDDVADLVTSMSAAHWFDHPRFLREADRILRPGGCLALLSYTMDFELEHGESTSKLNEICQEFYAALLPYRKAYIGSSSLQLYKKIFDLVSYDDKEWHECLKVRMTMPLSRFIGLVETFSSYQGFLEKDPVEAKKLSQTITDRLLEAMGASSPDTEVIVIVKYFYLLASKPQKS
ncbi:putative S-adenosylmethionine-dependent methyltransferase CRG1 [Anabarilius grahami]|uniref:Putative S-adenosylmethionine-dependent methyltransferase CRG1 n=1 Tax=Anabarilius grahami TaxID=495550 RepID=A0A3N0XL32_ANAGA|nr:putative S-adenosylmethionine-dependent methyltransferase CRG1 [Anabarilius grahami]